MFDFKPEVLSPVGNREMLTAAVRSGADAVYLGLDSFNARRNAENFTVDSLREAVEFCHIRGVKVYLTLNILISDAEMKNAIEQTVEAAKAGIDGVITADIGFVKTLRKVLPLLPVHASTQMTVHSPSAIKPLREMGFSRVVVSREMSRTELAAFCEEAKAQNMEVEVFVHGALCMSVSGQCLLSAMLGGRSGNRGLCAGPCRLPFEAKNGNGYDLSLKDLSLIPYLNELKDMGVSSLKIEGRMKRPEYVAAATAACRQMLDNGFVDDAISSALEKVFSRSGFTDGYYTGKLGKDMFGIRTKDDVTAADTVFASLHELYRNDRQSVAIWGGAEIKEGSPVTLTVNDGVNTVTVSGDIPEKAINRPTDEAAVLEKLNKTGGTPYYFENLNLNIDEGLMVRVSSLNALRRDALEKLSALRAKLPEISPDYSVLKEYEKDFSIKELKTVIRLDSIDQLTEKAKAADLVLIPINTNPAALPENVNLAVELPRGISNEGYILGRLGLFMEKGIEVAFCSTLAATELAKTAGFKTVAHFGYNIYNSASAKYHKEQGSLAAVLSPELLLSDAKNITADIPKGLISYGRLPLMLTRNCPVKNGLSCADCGRKERLTDRKKAQFPVKCQNGYSELLNSKVIWLADRKKELIGLDFEILYFTDETPDRVDEVIDAYKKGAAPDCDFTRGLYFRGVE